MNTAVKLAYVRSAEPRGKFSDLECVRVFRDVVSLEGPLVPAGSEGAVVSVYPNEAYLVEFIEPFPALAEVDGEILQSAPSRLLDPSDCGV